MVIAIFSVMVITSSSCKYADRCVGLILSRIETREIPKDTVSAFIRLMKLTFCIFKVSRWAAVQEVFKALTVYLYPEKQIFYQSFKNEAPCS